MKIRIMGTQNECLQAKKYYEELAQSGAVSYCSVSGLYANRGSTNVYRIYIDIGKMIENVNLCFNNKLLED